MRKIQGTYNFISVNPINDGEKHLKSGVTIGEAVAYFEGLRDGFMLIKSLK